MATIKGLTIAIDGEVTGLNKALSGVNAKSRDLQKELRDVEKLLKLDPENTDLLAQRQKILAESVENTSEKLKQLKDAEKQVQKQFEKGEVSEEQYRALQREVIRTEQSLGRLESQASETNEEIQDVSESTKKLKTISKGAAVGATALGGALVAAAESTREYRDDIAKLETNAKQAGAGLDETREALKQLNQVSEEADSNVEALSNLLQAGFTDNNLQQAVDALSGAVIKFPDTLKIEGLADGLQETLATGAATGSFGEMLERLGYNLDTVNEGLSAATTEAEKQQYILDLLASTGLADVTQAYKDANPDIIAARDAQQELTEAMARLGSDVEPVMSDVKEIVAELIGWILDNKDAVISGLAGIAAGLLALNVVSMITGLVAAFKEYKLAQEGATVAQWLLNAAQKASPVGLVIALVVALVTAIMVLWNTNEDFRNAVIGIWETIKKKFSESIEAIKGFFGTFVENLKQLPKDIKTIGTNMAKGLWDGIVGMKDWLFGKAKAWVDGLLGGFREWFGDMKNIGKYVIEGLWNGISDKVKWLKGKVSGVVDAIKGWFTGKEGFDEHSPSKWAKGVGAFVTEGLANGILSAKDLALAAAKSVIGSTKKIFDGIMYDPTKDYMARIEAAKKIGDSARAEELEKIRNAKIDGEKLSWAKTFDFSQIKDIASALEVSASYAVAPASDYTEKRDSNVADVVGQALLSGMMQIADTIFEAMPKEAGFYLDGKKFARAEWGHMDNEGDRRTRMFAPTREQIAAIAMSVMPKEST